MQLSKPISAKDKDIGFKDSNSTLLYGKYGVGKTTFCTTLEKPILFFDVDNRNASYRGVSGVDFISYVETGKRALAYDTLMNDIRGYQSDTYYKNVILDSSTTTLDIMTNSILGLTGIGRGGTEGLSLAQWGTVTERFRKMFTVLRGYKPKVVVISHEQIIQDDLTKEILYLPMMIGRKFSSKSPLYFDEVYRCFTDYDREKKQTVYKLQTQASRKYGARTSYNLHDEAGHTIPILNQYEPQHYPTLIKKIKDAYAEPEKFLSGRKS